MLSYGPPVVCAMLILDLLATNPNTTRIVTTNHTSTVTLYPMRVASECVRWTIPRRTP